MVDPKPDPMISRDLVGYGEFPPDPEWPGNAKIAVNFNLNVEGGGELTMANGDDGSEGNLNDIGVVAKPGKRAPMVESSFEFGSRRGVWRVLNVFRDFKINISILGVARGLEQTPELTSRLCGSRPRSGQPRLSLDRLLQCLGGVEREHIKCEIEILTRLTSTRPVGWMTGRPGPNTAASCRSRRISL